jgi:hypothetical protein
MVCNLVYLSSFFFERSSKELASIYLAEGNFTGGCQEAVYTRERIEPQKFSEKRKY